MLSLRSILNRADRVQSPGEGMPQAAPGAVLFADLRRSALPSALIRGVVLLSLMALGSGCATAVSAGTSTALSGIDLVQMTDQMEMSILASPAVREAIAKEGRLPVVIQPVENYMTAEVLPRGAGEAFIGRLRGMLATHAREQFMWIMNRETYYKLRGQEVEGLDLGPNPDAMSPRYALTARFDSLADETIRFRTSSYLCVYTLTNLQTREQLWTDKYEVRKTAVRGFLD